MASPSTSVASSETPLRPQLPLKLGRFTLCEELGAGGMATVYLARMDLAAGLDRLVALKTIHPHLARERAFVDMFLDEARIASHVNHPNVCAVHDFGELGGVYYLAMEYLLGEPLFDVINRLVERFDDVREVLPFVAARVIADACEGIHAAHTARGPDGARLHIVHRDVSPQNLFITYDGSVKVVDFGCAKAAQRVAHTSTGVMKGKVGYASPEQLRADDVDARADIWALGVCLWEALTLSPLFTKETAMKTAMSVLEDPVPSAAEERSWVPAEIAAIAAKALHRDPAERYASARDMSRDLRKFIADSGFTLESAELAEWMGFLFEEQHDERARQASRAREIDVSSAEALSPAQLVDDVAPGEVELLPDSMSAMDALIAHEQNTAAPPPPLPSTPSAPPRARRGRWLALLALLALAVGGYYLQRYYEPAPWLLELVGVSPEDEPGQLDSDSEGDAAELAGAEDPPAMVAAVVDAGADDADAGGEVSETEPVVAQLESDAGPPRRRGGGGGGGVTTVVSGGGSRGAASGSGASGSGASSSGASSSGAAGSGSSGSSTSGSSSPAPAPSAAFEGGFVHIVPTSGWAEVQLDGRTIGRTPLRRELPAGHHRLRVLPYGQEPGTVLDVRIEAGIDQRLDIDLPPPP